MREMILLSWYFEILCKPAPALRTSALRPQRSTVGTRLGRGRGRGLPGITSIESFIVKMVLPSSLTVKEMILPLFNIGSKV
jgi:hypothetical protein